MQRDQYQTRNPREGHVAGLRFALDRTSHVLVTRDLSLPQEGRPVTLESLRANEARYEGLTYEGSVRTKVGGNYSSLGSVLAPLTYDGIRTLAHALDRGQYLIIRPATGSPVTPRKPRREKQRTRREIEGVLG